MNDDLETYAGLKIEIEVKCGRVSEVCLRTMIELPDRELVPANKAKIRDTILFLRSTMPVQEIKSEDAWWEKSAREPAVGPDGKLTFGDPGLAAAKAGQNDIKKVLGVRHVNPAK